MTCALITQVEVLRVLKESPGPLTCKEVAVGMGLEPSACDFRTKCNKVWARLDVLAHQGYVEKVPCGDVSKWRVIA